MFKIILILLIPTICLSQESEFKNESEVSLIQTGGNSSVETYNAKTHFSLKKKKRSYSFGGHYTYGSTEQVNTNGEKENIISARNWDAHTRYEQELNKDLSGFTGLQFEGDEFSGYNQRENIDIGAKHIFLKTDKALFFAELGARYTVERKTTRDKDNEDVFNYSKGRLFLEYSKKTSETFSYKFWAEYLPNFTENDDYLINFEPSIAYILSSTFSLKTAYKGIYDNAPSIDDAGERKEYLDFTFTTSIIAKF